MFKDGKDYDADLRKINFYGRVHSEESIALMRKAKLGKKATAETCSKMRLAAKTKPPRSIESILAITKYVYHTPAGKFNTRKQAMQGNNISRDMLTRRCKSDLPKHAEYCRINKMQETA